MDHGTIAFEWKTMQLGATAFWSAPVSWRFFRDEAQLPARKRQDTGALQNAVAPNWHERNLARL